MAVAGGHEHIYDILIKAGANVNKYSVKVSLIFHESPLTNSIYLGGKKC